MQCVLPWLFGISFLAIWHVGKFWCIDQRKEQLKALPVLSKVVVGCFPRQTNKFNAS